jgi:hypothetical protein
LDMLLRFVGPAASPWHEQKRNPAKPSLRTLRVDMSRVTQHHPARPSKLSA